MHIELLDILARLEAIAHCHVASLYSMYMLGAGNATAIRNEGII